ncbi:Proteasome subunit beta type-4 [Gurleya vavrai]
MDSSVAIKTKNFVIIASDMNVNSSILLQKDNHKKIYTIDNTIFSYSGPQGSSFRLCSFAIESATLTSLYYNVKSTPTLLKTIIRKQIHESIRRDPVKAGCLIGGKDLNGYRLFFVDMYGAFCEENYFCQGMSSYVGYGVLHDNYREEMSVEEAILLIKKVYNVLKKRIVVRCDKIFVKIVSEDGVKEEEIDLSE